MNQEALQILIMVNNHRGDMEETTSEAGIISNMAAPR